MNIIDLATKTMQTEILRRISEKNLIAVDYTPFSFATNVQFGLDLKNTTIADITGKGFLNLAGFALKNGTSAGINALEFLIVIDGVEIRLTGLVNTGGLCIFNLQENLLTNDGLSDILGIVTKSGVMPVYSTTFKTALEGGTFGESWAFNGRIPFERSLHVSLNTAKKPTASVYIYNYIEGGLY